MTYDEPEIRDLRRRLREIERSSALGMTGPAMFRPAAGYRHEAIAIVDPIKVFAAISGLLGAVFLLIFVLVLVPRNAEDLWPAELMGAWTLMFFAPLLTCFGPWWPRRRGRPPPARWYAGSFRSMP